MPDFSNLMIKGDVFTDEIHLLLYSTDASAYKEKPIAVIQPKDTDDIKKIIEFARKEKLSVVPRTAGTSLAGQVVGSGIIVDVSKYMTNIIEINKAEKWIRVQPGVVLDELNQLVAESGLFFGPETSTSNRCMIGGMLGNNACGAHSLIYGSTRDHTLSVNCILSDGSEVEFEELNIGAFEQKCNGNTFENKLYKNINEILSKKEHQKEIRKEFPDKDIKRRNTAYAIDLLLESNPFTSGTPNFNFSKLIAGSEGTLAFITEIKLNLIPLPPKNKLLICVHHHSIKEALYANIQILKHQPSSIELMDDLIMECIKGNITQSKNRFFIQGNPGAILIVEFMGNSIAELEQKSTLLIDDLKKQNMGYHYPLVWGNDIPKVWNLRKAGLGLLSNIPGDAKAVPVVEDTAVNPKVLPNFIAEFDKMLKTHNLICVYYAHIATGELHLRPVLNLKNPKDVELFHTIALKTAHLVKKYNGSLSGEHGDGRLRGEFIPLMIGEKNYKLIKEIKKVWDPENIFNPQKIVDTPKMNTSLRYKTGQKSREFNTYFDFSKDNGLLRAIEKCNGSGDCRKSAVIGGTMCPSFMASKDEDKTTRARANILREFLTNSTKENPFNHKEVYEILDLCLSCKACKSECPSSVDITKYKAEFLQHYYDTNGVSFRNRLIANITKINSFGSNVPTIFNFFISNSFFSGITKQLFGFAPKRSIPVLGKYTLRCWANKQSKLMDYPNGKVYLFADEFTNYNDTELGITAIKLLNKLGYEVIIPDHKESGRTYLSKGLLKKAKILANENVRLLKNIITEEHPLIGIEPSGILSFRDEYPELVEKSLVEAAKKLAAKALMFDEFIMQEVAKGKIAKDIFSNKIQKVKLHGHCHQKALATTEATKKMLSLPANYEVTEIKSGCCGMAGSFGYEKEHYEFSMKVGELVLFPEVRNSDDYTIISAPGTSCRHQIKDGTGKTALHPIEVLYQAIC
jgi:FAD/FMN-containing dehydrogenase/Fe-S oxidoreductase